MPARLHVNLAALASNYKVLAAGFSGETAAVIKADAYGLGAANVAHTLLASGCRIFFVAHLEEALRLDIESKDVSIYVFHGVQPGEEKLFLERGIVPVLNTFDQVRLWLPYMEKCPPALHVDTGMCRLGLTQTDIANVPK